MSAVRRSALLAGHAPFHDKSIPQKLVSHQMRQPKPITSLRKDVPDELAAVLSRMMAKKPAERFQRPQEIVQALLPWTEAPVPMPAARDRAANWRESAVFPEEVGPKMTRSGINSCCPLFPFPPCY